MQKVNSQAQFYLLARSAMARQMVCPGCQMLVVLLRFLGHIYYNFFTIQFTLFSVQFNECLTNAHISYATTTKIKIQKSSTTTSLLGTLQNAAMDLDGGRLLSGLIRGDLKA